MEQLGPPGAGSERKSMENGTDAWRRTQNDPQKGAMEHHGINKGQLRRCEVSAACTPQGKAFGARKEDGFLTRDIHESDKGVGCAWSEGQNTGSLRAQNMLDAQQWHPLNPPSQS